MNEIQGTRRPMCIQVVNDNISEALELQALLSENKLRGATISTFNEVNELFNDKANSFSSIAFFLIDIDSVHRSGIELCKRLKQNPKSHNIPILLLTSQTASEYIRETLDAGADDFIVKPIYAIHLLPRIKVFAERYRLQNEKIVPEPQNACFPNLLDIPDGEKLERSQKSFEFAVKSVNAGLFQYDIKHKELTLDDRSLAIFGLSKEQFSNDYESWRQVIHPADLIMVEKRFRTFLASPKNYLRIEYRTIKPSGEHGYVIASVAVERDKKLVPIQLYGLHLDFAEKFYNEQALRESHKKYQQLTESLHEIVWRVDLEGQIQYLNPAFTKIFGIEHSKGNYPSLSEFLFPESIGAIHETIKREQEKVLTEGIDDNITVLELKGKHKNGELIYLEVSADFVLDDDNRPIAIQGVMHDITQRIKSELELDKYKAELEDMVLMRTQELEINKNELRLIFDRTPVMMVLLGENMEIQNINKRGAEFTRKNISELKGKQLGDALRCYNCTAHGGCGLMDLCKTCDLRSIIQKTYDEKENQDKVETKVWIEENGTFVKHFVNISTAVISDEPKVLVVIDDITVQKTMQQALLESEEKYRKLFETKNEAVLFLDAKTKQYVDANNAACELYGYSYQELITMTPNHISAQKKDTTEKLKELINTNKKQTAINRVCKRKDGRKVVVEIQNTIFTFRGKKTICSTHRDITEKEDTLRKLKESEHTFRMIVENIDKVFWIYDTNLERLIYISPQYKTIIGRKLYDIYEENQKFIKDAHPVDRWKLINTVNEIKAGKKTSIEYRMMTANNSIKWLSLKSFGYYQDDQRQLIFGLASDITSQKEAERKILKAILETESREREMFAKELHDGLGANLSAIKMSLERLNDPATRPEKKLFYSQYALELITQASNTSREISYNLKPHTLVNLGLVPSIEMLCSNINGLGQMLVTFTHSCHDEQFGDETELAIYRILNEFTNNSLKYAQAEKANIELTQTDEKLILTYSDNGKGFDPEQAKMAKGSGLKNIIARVEALGGEINIQSEIDKGMKTKIELVSKAL